MLRAPVAFLLSTVLAIPKPTGLFVLSIVLASLAVPLLSGAAWGVNLSVWAVSTATLLSFATRGMALPASTKAFGVIAVLFALLFSLRDSDSLRTANGVAMAFCLGAMLLPLAGQTLKDASLGTLIGSPFVAGGNLLSGARDLAERARTDREAVSNTGQRSRAIFRGLLIATPLLIVFGALFASADAIFRNQVETLGQFNLDPQKITDHILTFAFSVVLVAGLLYRFNLAGGPRRRPRDRNRTKPIGMIEGSVVLGSLAALFGSFLLVQFRYLFGAQDVVNATHGLSYAEYARGGFFELVVVAALTLAVLIGADALLRRDRPLDEALYRWLGRILGGMVFLIVGSALIRMRLYTDTFGLTELRVYATVFMLWLTLAFIWLFATTLCGHPQRFAFGLLVTGLGVITATNLANPDRLIVQTNLLKPNADFGYLETLGDDAAVALRDMKASIPAEQRPHFENLVRRKLMQAQKGDWRETTWASWSLVHE